MKKILKNSDIIGGIFGLVAILAIIVEMALGEFEASAVAGGVKDIAGTMATIVLMLTAIRAFKPRTNKNFEDTYEQAMESLCEKYNPLLKKADIDGRYNIASRIDSLFDNTPGEYHTFFDFDKRNTLNFTVSKTVFMGRTKEDFSTLQAKIVSDIAGKLKDYQIVGSIQKTQAGFKVSLSKEVTTAEDAEAVAELIDAVLLLYVAESKR